MIITDIVQNKSNDKFSVFVDDEFAFSLAKSDIVFFKLDIGEEISEKKFKYIYDEVVMIKAKNRAAKFLGASKKTEKAVYDKLIESGFDEDVCEKVIADLKKYGYVDDYDYALTYIGDRIRLNPRSAFAIKTELRQKGVKDSIINSALEEAGIDEIGDIKRLIEKKTGGVDDLDDRERKRLIDFLMRRGYSYGKIKEAITHFDDDFEE